MPESTQTKTCIRCNRTRLKVYFHKRRAEADGYDYYCKDCQREKTTRMADERAQQIAEGKAALADVKACRECGEVKPLLDFSPRRDQADGHHWWCIDCKRAKDRAYGKVYRENNPEQKRQSARKYVRKADVRELRSKTTLREKYGLTPESLLAKIEAQGGNCPFCPPGTDVTNWDVDHDHECCPDAKTCGKCLRDILCHKHNLGLGYWNDDPVLLRQAAEYIESHRARINAAAPKADQAELWDEVPVHRAPRRPARPSVDLTPEQVIEIREAHRTETGLTQYALAARYGVSQPVVSNIVNDRTHRGVQPQTQGT